MPIPNKPFGIPNSTPRSLGGSPPSSGNATPKGVSPMSSPPPSTPSSALASQVAKPVAFPPAQNTPPVNPRPVTPSAQALPNVGNAAAPLAKVASGLGLVLQLLALPSVVEDVSRAVADLSTLPLRLKILSERERLDKLLKEREKLAQAIDSARVDSFPPKNPPPFTGGQQVGVGYTLVVKRTGGGGDRFIAMAQRGAQVGVETIGGALFNATGGGIPGRITGVIGDQVISGTRYITIGAGTPNIVFALPVNSGFVFGGQSYQPYDYSFVGAFRRDGQPDTGGNPPSLIPSQAPTIPAPYPPPSEWLYGSPLVTVGGNAAKMLDGMKAVAPSMPIMKGDPKSSPDNLGLPTTTNPEIAKSPNGFNAVPSSVPSASSAPSASPPSANSGLVSVPATQTPVTELYNKRALPEFKQVAPPAANSTPQYNKGSQVAPTPPASKAPEQFTIPAVDPNAALIMGAIAAGTATTTNLLNQINQQTKPENQQANAKEGACQAMNSPSCRKDMVDDIKNPINQNIDAKTGLLAANQLGQDVALGSILAKVTSVFERLGRLFDNSLIDKAMQYITMITVIHNAAMLSRGIAETLGSALDQGLQVFGLQAKMEDKDGAITGVNAVLGKSFENLIKGIIGADNYTALNNTWIQANRIYQAGINLISNVQSILDSTTAVAELTSNRLGTWMNAARSAGLVRENAYGAQSENVTKFNAFMNKLENLEQGVSNVSSITGNILSVQQTVTEIKTNRQEFENALKDKPQGTGLPENDPAKAAAATKKEQSVWTIADFSIVKPPELP